MFCQGQQTHDALYAFELLQAVRPLQLQPWQCWPVASAAGYIPQQCHRTPLCMTLQEDTDKELREFTPSFLWLLRDFYLKLEDEYGRKVTGAL